MTIKFTIRCYPERIVPWDDPAHPRHAFPENWDSADHPRFDFEHIESAIRRLIAKGYTVRTDVGWIRIHHPNGDLAFKMDTSA